MPTGNGGVERNTLNIEISRELLKTLNQCYFQHIIEPHVSLPPPILDYQGTSLFIEGWIPACNKSIAV